MKAKVVKVVVEFGLSIVGECSEKKAKEVFLSKYGIGKMLTAVGVIVSDDVDGTNDYIVMIDGWQEIKRRGKSFC